MAFIMAPIVAQAPNHNLVWELQSAGGPSPDLLALEHRAYVRLATSDVPVNTHYLWSKEVFLPMRPTAFRTEEVHQTPDLRFVGTCQDQYVLVSAHLDGPRSLPASAVLDLLHYITDPTLAAVHVSLAD